MVNGFIYYHKELHLRYWRDPISTYADDLSLLVVKHCRKTFLVFHFFSLLELWERYISKQIKLFRQCKTVLFLFVGWFVCFFEKTFSRIIPQKDGLKNANKKPKEQPFLVNFYSKVQGITLQSYKYRSVFVEFLNSNGFKLQSPAQLRIISSQLCRTVIGKTEFKVIFISIYSTICINQQISNFYRFPYFRIGFICYLILAPGGTRNVKYFIMSSSVI